MSIVQKGNCQIKFLDNAGRGVGFVQDEKITVPYTIPGEKISFDKHQYRKKSNYVLSEITYKSPNRIDPICEYFTQCGGCSLQHLSILEYTTFKQDIALKNLNEYGIKTNIMPLVSVSPGKRRRANFEAVKKEGKLFMGFHKLASHKIIDINSCPALLPSLSRLIPSIKNLLFNILGLQQKAKIFVTQASNGIDINLEIYGQKFLDEEKKNYIKIFARENNLIRAVFRARKFIDIIYQLEEPFVLFGQVKVKVDSYCFLQASFESDSLLQEIILQHTPINKPNIKGADLFCGRGTFCFPLSQHYEMDCFESEPKALEALTQTAIFSKRKINVIKQDLFLNPISSESFDLYNFAIINPPRCGAYNQILKIAQSNLKTVIYISCNPTTFARDAKILAQNYSLEKVYPVDQFYWSHHLELVGIFKKI